MTLNPLSHDKVELFSGDSICALTYTLTFEGKRQTPSDIRIEGTTIHADFGELGIITDEIEEEKPLVLLKRSWNLKKAGSYRLQAAFSYQDEELENQLFIPALWYRGNSEGKGCFPSCKTSTTWSFLETRMSIPCCAQLSNGKRLFTCATEPAAQEQYLASVANERHGLIISIPGSEWPYTYRGKKSLVPTSGESQPCLQVGSQGLIHERTFYLANQKNQDSLDGYCQFVASLPKQKDSNAGDLPSWEDWFEYKLTRLLNLVRSDEHGLAYLAMGEGNHEVQDVYAFTSASFLVKSLQGAYEMALHTAFKPRLDCLLKARKRLCNLFSLKDDEYLLAKVAKKIGDFFLQAERQEGVFQDNHDLVEGIWGGYLGIGEHPEFRTMVNSRCNGEAMKHYVLLATHLRGLGLEMSSYISLARRVAHFYCEAQLSSGSFGRWWTDKGKPGDIKGTNGSYIASFFCTFIPLLDKDDPLRAEMYSAVHQAFWYYSELAFEGAFYGDTLDADSCDKEAGVALLSFFLDFYELEHDKRQLESASLAARFLVQWIWQQDSFLKPDSPLGSIGFHTTGMTSVSVAHHHLDFYGMAIAYEFLRFSQYSGDRFYIQQAMLMIQACRQLVATEENPLSRDKGFVGWQPEQMNHTLWEYFDRPELMGGHYDIDIAWVTVLTLGSFTQIKNNFSYALEE